MKESRLRSIRGTSKLRWWTPGVLFGVFALLTAAQYLAGRQLYDQSFIEAERRDLLARARHAQAILRHSFLMIGTAAADYAAWEKTQLYVAGRDPGYPKRNWQADTFRGFDVDILLISDRRGRLLLGRKLEPNRLNTGMITPELARTILNDNAVAHSAGNNAAKEGFLSIGSDHFQWASAPVLSTEVEGKVMGYLTLLRALDSRFEARAATTLDAEFDIKSVPRSAQSESQSAEPLQLESLSFAVLPDGELETAFSAGPIATNRVLRIVLTTERALVSTVTRSSAFALGSSVLVGIVLCLLAWSLLNARLLGPLLELSARMRWIGVEGERGERIPVPPHDDEIAAVAQSANRMLDRIEAQKDAERTRDAALAASRLKSEFLATMSHEIRTPMNGVLGTLELLDGTELDAEQRARVATARSSAAALLDILNQILDISKLEAGRFTLDLTPTDVTELARSVTNLFHDAASRKGVMLQLHLEGDLANGYETDGLRLRQVLVNLLGNAVKFTDHGRIDLRISRQPANKQTDILRFEVADSGVGMTEDELRRIFDAFTQADASTTRRFGGTGLGLTISKRILDLMGSQIECRSQPGQGATFQFELRLRRTGPAIEKVLELTPEVPRGLRLLVAEDNPVNQQLARAMLAKLGCEVTVVEHGAAAVATVLADARRFDLILMDLHMPQMDGLEATRRIRAAEALASAPRRLPIVALTAAAFDSDRDACLLAGMDDFLSKPFGMSGLASVLVRNLTVATTVASNTTGAFKVQAHQD